MFSSLAAALQGPAEDPSQDGASSQGEEDASPSDSAPAAAIAPSFWSVASAITATVKARTAELATSIQVTDWREELVALQRGLKEDTEDLGHKAGELAHKARTAAEHLPAAVEHLPKQTSKKLSVSAQRAASQLGQAGRSLGGLSQRLVESTNELLDQVGRAMLDEGSGPAGGLGGARSASAAAFQAGGHKYNRLEADIAAMQRDSATYCDEPEDAEAFAAWLLEFDLRAARPEVEALLAGNTFMSELQARIVPLVVDYDTFWTRYFYRLHRLRLKHEAVRRAAERCARGGAGDEEESGWGSEDEEEVAVEASEPAQAAEPAEGASQAPAEGAGEAPSAAEQAQPSPHGSVSEQSVDANEAPGSASQSADQPADEAPASGIQADAKAEATGAPSMGGSGADNSEQWSAVSSGAASSPDGQASLPSEAAAAGGQPGTNDNRKVAAISAADAALSAAVAATTAAVTAASSAPKHGLPTPDECDSDFELDGGADAGSQPAGAGGGELVGDDVDENWGEEDWE